MLADEALCVSESSRGDQYSFGQANSIQAVLCGLVKVTARNIVSSRKCVLLSTYLLAIFSHLQKAKN